MQVARLIVTLILLPAASLFALVGHTKSSNSPTPDSAIHNIAVPNTGNLFGTVELERLGGERATIWNDAQEGRRYYYLPSLLPEWLEFSNLTDTACASLDDHRIATSTLRIHLSDQVYEKEIRDKIATLTNIPVIHENMLSAIPYDNIQIVLLAEHAIESRLIYDARGRSRMSRGESVHSVPLLSYPREIEATIEDTCAALRALSSSARAGKTRLKGRIYFQGVAYRTTSFSVQMNKFLDSERAISLFGKEALVRRMSFSNTTELIPNNLGEELHIRLPIISKVAHKGKAKTSRQRLLSRDFLDYAGSHSFATIAGGCVEASTTSTTCKELQARFVTFLVDHAESVELNFNELANGSVELMKNQIAYATLEPSDYKAIAKATPNINANVDELEFVASDQIKWDLSGSDPVPTSVNLLLLDEDKLRSEIDVYWYEKIPVEEGSKQYMAVLDYFGPRIANGMIVPYDTYVEKVNLRNSCLAGGSIKRLGAGNVETSNGVRNGQPVGVSDDYRTVVHKHRHNNCGINFVGKWMASPGHFFLNRIGVTPIVVERTWAAGGWRFNVDKTPHDRDVPRKNESAQMLQSISYNGRAERGYNMFKKLTCGAILKFELRQYPVSCAPFLIDGFGISGGG